jgi:hypothetical protein
MPAKRVYQPGWAIWHLFVIKVVHKLDYPKQEQKWRSGQLEGYTKTGIFSKQLSGDKHNLAG